MYLHGNCAILTRRASYV